MVERDQGLGRRALLGTGLGAGALLAGAGTAGRARAQGGQPAIRIGFLTDLSGPYKDITGETGAICARQAIADFGAAEKGMRVEVLVADHQHRPDVGIGIIREWFDRGDVDVILDVGNSAIGLAAGGLVTERNKIQLNTGAASSDLTGKSCNANTIHWPYDTWSNANSAAQSLLSSGGNRWFFVTADYAFGKAMQADATRIVEAGGGQVVGSAVHPFPGTTDFSSYLVQARARRANVVAFANAGADTLNCVKQAAEFGLARSGIRPAALVAFIQDIKALGLDVAQGLTISESFYWDLNDRTRAFTERLKPRLTNGGMPNMDHAAAYSSTLHYLKAVSELGVARAKADGRAVVATMKAMPTEDDCFGRGSVRADGRKIHPMYLFEAKKPSESTGPWDLLKLVGTTPADRAFRPLSEGGCSLVTN
ncbi:ABC transporter substrate-binding protein [Pararoseomonas indoligenes]|uniref:ABC transporter substrate-binding protein n=1 Tax=Roseomonas indoligenes TaxID=2820811 RepID=A0A940S819_9PROT|nr:ABC transporter substrate-binding protein [Pararoseomonas indoligenes]MBP0495490.1 ABC transporter substrate-binding protein [Pararoseomonas indoligenes]